MSVRSFTVTARDREPDGWRSFTLTGQEARSLHALVEAGDRGVTALEASAWAFRLAAYCHALRRKHGLAIRTDREPHPGGWHGRHVLESVVELVEVAVVSSRRAA